MKGNDLPNYMGTRGVNPDGTRGVRRGCDLFPLVAAVSVSTRHDLAVSLAPGEVHPIDLLVQQGQVNTGLEVLREIQDKHRGWGLPCLSVHSWESPPWKFHHGGHGQKRKGQGAGEGRL